MHGGGMSRRRNDVIMGFFSRRHEDNQTSTRLGAGEHSRHVKEHSEESSRSLRSRFSIYGKLKKSSQTLDSTPSKSYLHPSTAGTLSRSTKSNPYASDGDSLFSDTSSYRPITPAASPRRDARTTPNRVSLAGDTATMTLAQRLDELATANNEGLLNDDEYRLLRQNLFERFATTAQVPVEVSVVPASVPAVKPDNFHISAHRSGSVRSKTSITSSVTSLFRRGSSSEKVRTSTDDAASVWSSRGSLFSKDKVVIKVDSSPSLHNESSISRSSTRSRRVPATPPSSFYSKGISLSDRSRSKTPHSAMPTFNLENTASVIGDDDESRLKTAKDIRAEIEAVEAEGRRLLDAFNGLELTTLTKRHPTSRVTLERSGSSRKYQRDDTMSVRSGTSAASSLRPTTPQSARYQRTPASPSTPLVSKPVSLRRKVSLTGISSRSAPPSTSSFNMSPPPIPSIPSPLGRLYSGSSSSLNLGMRSTGNLSIPPTNGSSLDVLSENTEVHNISRGKSSDSVVDLPGNRARSGSNATTHSGRHPYAAAAADTAEDAEISALETEMADIRKRRAEVTKRYDVRIEYLRAKLKGAELHEKLMKK